MRELAYPAVIKYDKRDKAYLVEFPNLPGCVTFGESLSDAKTKAKEALSGYLASIFDRHFKVPRPSTIKGKNVHLISPESAVSISILLRNIREGLGLSQTQAAKRLGISYQSYQKLENPKRANPTLKTLEKVAKAFAKSLVMTIVDAA